LTASSISSIEKGEQKGKFENTRQIAKNMIDSDISVEQVVKFTSTTGQK